MDVDNATATDSTQGTPAGVPAQPTAANSKGSATEPNEGQGTPSSPGNTGNGNEGPQKEPDGDISMATGRNNPTAGEKENAGKGVQFKEGSADVKVMYPWLVECKVRAQSGERPFDVFKECGQDLMVRLNPAAETDALFKVGTLKKTGPYKSPSALPLECGRR